MSQFELTEEHINMLLSDFDNTEKLLQRQIIASLAMRTFAYRNMCSAMKKMPEPSTLEDKMAFKAWYEQHVEPYIE